MDTTLMSLKMILYKQRPLIDIWHYFVGNYRYKLWFSWYFKWLLRWHIREQIKFRLQYIPKECWESGSCVKCGCQVPHLQMANKVCEGICYPELMNSRQWSRFMIGSTIKQKDRYWYFNSVTNVVTLVIEKLYNNVSERKPKLR